VAKRAPEALQEEPWEARQSYEPEQAHSFRAGPRERLRIQERPLPATASLRPMAQELDLHQELGWVDGPIRPRR